MSQKKKNLTLKISFKTNKRHTYFLPHITRVRIIKELHIIHKHLHNQIIKFFNIGFPYAKGYVNVSLFISGLIKLR